jgi:tetratricopeptide (TPR) repeat protein
LLTGRCSGCDSLAVASDRAALAAILDGRCKYQESENHHRAALTIYRRHYGASHPEIAVVLNNLGALYQAIGQTKRAELYHRKALPMKHRVLNANHPDLALTMNNLALLQSSQGRCDLARPLLKSALQILNVSVGSSHPHTKKVRRNYENLLVATL